MSPEARPTTPGTIGIDSTSLEVMAGWKAMQYAECHAADRAVPRSVFSTAASEPVRPPSISQAFGRFDRRAGVPAIRLRDLRYPHGSLLIAAGVPAKAVSERLGHAHLSFTVETYRHDLPRMRTDGARVIEALVAGEAPANLSLRQAGWNTQRNSSRKPVERARPGWLTRPTLTVWWRGQD